MPYPTKPKGGSQRPCQVVVDKSTAQIRERKVTRKFANKYKDILQKTDTMVNGQNNPQGPYLYREGGKIYASLPTKMLEGIQQSELYEKMKKDCKVEGIEIQQNIMAQDPITHVLTPQEYMKNLADGKMPPMCNFQVLANKTTPNAGMRFMMMEFRTFSRPQPPKTPGPPKHK